MDKKLKLVIPTEETRMINKQINNMLINLPDKINDAIHTLKIARDILVEINLNDFYDELKKLLKDIKPNITTDIVIATKDYWEERYVQLDELWKLVDNIKMLLPDKGNYERETEDYERYLIIENLINKITGQKIYDWWD